MNRRQYSDFEAAPGSNAITPFLFWQADLLLIDPDHRPGTGESGEPVSRVSIKAGLPDAKAPSITPGN